MSQIEKIKSLLLQSANINQERCSMFFKTKAGQYAETEQFIGISVPALRKISKEFANLSLPEIQILLESKVNEERLLALLILVTQYTKATIAIKDELCQFYLHNLKHVNNWNLVDASAHLILGAHLYKADKSILFILAKSEIMWERRIAIIATWYFIRHNELGLTFKIAEILLSDKHDLIHKAVGWMLREAGKRHIEKLIAFLDQYAQQMPRTMLRYAIEKFDETQRKEYMRFK